MEIVASFCRMKSLPVWGEWIEIMEINLEAIKNASLSPCGESGLKYPAGRYPG